MAMYYALETVTNKYSDRGISAYGYRDDEPRWLESEAIPGAID